MKELTELYAQMGISPAVYAYGEQTVARLRERFEAIDQVAEYNQAKVLAAFRKNRVSATCFAASTGYGYNDEGRDKLEQVYADVFHTEAAPDRPQVQFKPAPAPIAPAKPAAPQSAKAPKQENFFRTMTAEEYKTFSAAVKDAPKPSPLAAAATAAAVERSVQKPVKEQVILPKAVPTPLPKLPEIKKPEPVVLPVQEEEPEQTVIETMPAEIPWRYVGELYNSYIIVEQGEEAYLIDKHAAHERILFEKLKANQETISSQHLLTPVPCRLSPEEASILMANKALLDELGFEAEEFGENTLLLRQIPMDLGTEQAQETLEQMAADLLNGRRENRLNVRDEILHTVACKAAIKAGWQTSETELKVLIEQVMSRDDLKHCPHASPI